MKKLLLLFMGIGLFFTANTLHAQSGDNCANAAPFCTGTTYNFPNNTGLPSIGAGGAYGCLGSTPNPVWYFMEILNPGNLSITINQTSTGGSGIDVDFVCWGPFANQAAMCPGYSAGNIVDCSYSTAATEVVDITGASTGQFYLLLMTNYSGQAGNISFSQTGGAGTTNCAVLCNITSVTATPGACNPSTGLYSVSGQVSVTYPPTTGTLTVSSSCGGSTTISAPFSSPVSYTIPGITADGAGCTVTAAFSADATCVLSQGYTSPVPCITCAATANNTGPYCAGSTIALSATGGGTYSWTGPGGYTSPLQNPTLSSSTTAMSGTYTVTVTNATATCTATTVVTVNPSSSAAWSQPPPMCVVDPAIDLNTFVTGTAGGTWSGSGVSGSMFDPSGLSGSIAVTYTVGTPPCGGTSTLNITVTPNTPPTITSVPTQCSTTSPFNLAVDIAGGTWSGPGITNAASGTFDPSAASPSSQVIYTIPGSCAGADTITITVIPGPDPSWTTTAPLCANNGPINLDSLLTGTSGGTWSGSGVSGSVFNPSGLSGAIPVTYSVGSTCIATSMQNITVIPNSDASWTTTSICQISSPVNLDSLVTGTSGGTWSGTGVTGSTFNPSGLSGNIAITYTAGTAPCQAVSTQNINVVPLSDASWTTTSMCSDAAVFSLDPTVTGTAGGTWSGTGVTGSSFDPNGLSGPVSVTYTVGPVGCQASSAQNITVTPAGNAAWTTTSVCASSAAINLDLLVTGTSGGTWSGTGVTGSSFDPAGLSGNIAVTYIVGSLPCQDTLVQNITVVPASSAAWTTTSMCSSATTINLDSLVTGTTGGTWSGTGVTGNSFNPSGLSGGIAVTYTVGPVGCSATSTQNITVTPAANPAWTTTSMCSSATPLNLNTLVTGTGGGTWSGTGVTGSTFNPSGLSGPISVTYTVGTAPCVSLSTQNITVTPVASSAWTSTSVCANASPVNLNSLVTGTAGGTWSGTGVTGSTFNPSGLSGSISVTYTVGTVPCTSVTTHVITVTPNANATITSVSPMCQTASPFTLSAAGSGGTWSGTGITNPATGLFSPATATPGTYTISYGIAGACGDTGTVSITVLPTPSAAWSMPSFICESAAPVDLGTLVTGVAGGTFSGSGVSGNIFDPTGLSGNTTITYSVTQSGCSSTSSQVVDVDPITAAFTATPLSGMAPVSVTTLNGSLNAVSYAWNFGNGATSAATNPSTVYTGMGNYTIVLIATNANGCRDTASIGVHVDELSALLAPNVFTPNGDGHNDIFHPVIAEGLSEFKATVYDRWGLKMYEWSDENMGWNGKAKNGSAAPDGTYFWMISGKGVDGKAYDFTGFVQLFN
ncbi:MAG: hypothetical protein JWO44_2220 [Bacteroidetes bacterium]|nr:hypothetical protein [Bacteroidota bacterium]